MRFEKFSNIIEDTTSNYIKIKKEDYQTLGLFPIIDQGQAFIGGYTDDEKLIVKDNLPVIIFGDHTKNFKYIDFPFTIGADGVKVLSLKNQSFNTKYYFYFLKTLRLTNAGYSRHFKYLKVCKLPIPENIDDQLHIANILSKAENLISQRKESIRLLDEYLKSTFLEMFGDPVRNEHGWKIKKLNEITHVGTGGTPSRKKESLYYNGYVFWAKTTEVKGTYIFNTEERITDIALKESNCKVYPVNTILLAMYGQGKTRGNVGLLMIESSTNQACAAIPPTNSINHLFLFKLLKYSYEFLRSLARGGNQENLNLNIVGNIDIIMPPSNLQTEYVKIVEKTETIKVQYQQSLMELENLYGSLSQMAFKGELSIKDEKLMMAAEPGYNLFKKCRSRSIII